MIVKTGTVQANATEASLQIVWVLAKHKKSYMDAEVVKECMVAASEVLYEDKKLVDMVKQIPLSDSTATRRSDDLAENIFDQLINDIKLAQVFALACDESTDKTDIAQLCVYVRFFNGTGFREELLALLPLHGQTRGEDIFKVLSDFLTQNGLDVTKIVSLTTDGAPAMTGRERGLVGRLKLIQPHLISYHCIIHQSVLCSKLSDEFNDVMGTVMKVVNYIRANSSMQHRLFKSFLEQSSAPYDDLLLHNDVRWLSKGRVMERFWSLRTEVNEFLQTLSGAKTEVFQTFMSDASSMARIAFLVDITGYLNELNLSLQGRNLLVTDVKASCFLSNISLMICYSLMF